MFSNNSRYAKAGTYTIAFRGKIVTATKLPAPLRLPLIGYHTRLDGQRLDLIAARYLSDATAFWRLCDANNSLAPDALGAHEKVGIPEKGR